MNLIEAIKSGKRFRLKGCQEWLDAYYENCNHILCFLRYHNVLSDKWEVEEEKIEITEEMLKKVIVPEVMDTASKLGILVSSIDIRDIFNKLKELSK